MLNEPWRDEPDRLELEIEGYLALVLRHKELGHLCGYIGIPVDHPLYTENAHDLDLDAHGGLNFILDPSTTPMDPKDFHFFPRQDSKGKDLVWSGFDCGHLGDYSPYIYYRILASVAQSHALKTGVSFEDALLYAKEQTMVKNFLPRPDSHYRDIHFVTDQLTSLARQLKDAETP